MPNPGQEDADGDGLGDVCDADADSVPDVHDACVASEPGAVIDENGCTIVQLCPCNGEWKNHGAYVSCVAHVVDAFVDAGLVSASEKGQLVSQAAASDCGKTN